MGAEEEQEERMIAAGVRLRDLWCGMPPGTQQGTRWDMLTFYLFVSTDINRCRLSAEEGTGV